MHAMFDAHNEVDIGVLVYTGFLFLLYMYIFLDSSLVKDIHYLFVFHTC